MNKLDETYSFIGWVMYEKGYSRTELDEIEPFNLMMLHDEYVREVKERRK